MIKEKCSVLCTVPDGALSSVVADVVFSGSFMGSFMPAECESSWIPVMWGEGMIGAPNGAHGMPTPSFTGPPDNRPDHTPLPPPWRCGDVAQISRHGECEQSSL